MHMCTNLIEHQVRGAGVNIEEPVYGQKGALAFGIWNDLMSTFQITDVPGQDYFYATSTAAYHMHEIPQTQTCRL